LAFKKAKAIDTFLYVVCNVYIAGVYSSVIEHEVGDTNMWPGLRGRVFLVNLRVLWNTGKFLTSWASI